MMGKEASGAMKEKHFWNGKRLHAPGVWILILAGALGVLLLLIGSLGGEGDGDGETVETVSHAENSAEALNAYADALEAKIASLCESVSGVSRVRVAVTLSSGYEYVYAKDAEVNSGADGGVKGSYHYLTVGNGSSEAAVYLSEKPPTVGGIGIVCAGGGDPATKRELIELISAAFGVPSNKIYITEGR